MRIAKSPLAFLEPVLGQLAPLGTVWKQTGVNLAAENQVRIHLSKGSPLGFASTCKRISSAFIFITLTSCSALETPTTLNKEAEMASKNRARMKSESFSSENSGDKNSVRIAPRTTSEVQEISDTPNPISLEKPPSIPDLISGNTPPPDQDQLKKATENWFYGPGIGRTITNVGTVVAFPPYALYLIGNAGLSLAGLDQLFISDLLPEKPRDYFLQFYNGVTSVPGRVTSFAAGREYEMQSIAEQDASFAKKNDQEDITQ